MRRSSRPHSQQLALSLMPRPETPLITTEEPILLQALADLLLEALGERVVAEIEAMTMEAGDDPEDHA